MKLWLNAKKGEITTHTLEEKNLRKNVAGKVRVSSVMLQQEDSWEKD